MQQWPFCGQRTARSRLPARVRLQLRVRLLRRPALSSRLLQQPGQRSLRILPRRSGPEVGVAGGSVASDQPHHLKDVLTSGGGQAEEALLHQAEFETSRGRLQGARGGVAMVATDAAAAVAADTSATAAATVAAAAAAAAEDAEDAEDAAAAATARAAAGVPTVAGDEGVAPSGIAQHWESSESRETATVRMVMEVGVLRATLRTIPAGTGVATVVQSAAAKMTLASVAAILPDVALRLP